MDTAEKLIAKTRELVAPLQMDRGNKVRHILLGDLGLKSAALALAFLIWSISFFLIGSSVRTVTVPVEFSNVPENTEIARLSTNTVQVEIRGSAWVLDSMSLGSLVARFDLSGRKEGHQILSVGHSALSLPPGLIVENISPQKISVDLVRSGGP